MKILIIIILIFKFTICENYMFVFSIFRHGARAPFSGLNENNTDRFGLIWDKDSELTNVGRRQHFLLGYKNKKRYNQLLSVSYNLEDILVFSSDTDRTIMSAYSQLYGLYPPLTGPKINSNQSEIAVPPFLIPDLSEQKNILNDNSLLNQTQIFPIHVFSRYENYYYLGDTCKPFSNMFEKNINSSITNELKNNFIKKHGNQLKEKYNISLDSWGSVEGLCDNFICAYYDQRKLDIENMEEFKNDAIEILKNNICYIRYGNENSIISLIEMSPIFKSILEWMTNVIEQDKQFIGKKSPKMVLYSLHDDDICGMLNYLSQAFDLKYDYYPYFSSYINIELIQNNETASEDKYVNIIFNDDLILNSTWINFRDRVNALIYDKNEIDKFCGYSTNKFNIFEISSLALIIISVFLVLTILFMKRSNK